MAGEIVRMLTDGSRYAQMAEAGPRWIAERFTRERMIGDYFDFFTSIIGKKMGKGPACESCDRAHVLPASAPSESDPGREQRPGR
jgi:hypothetical protein